MEMEETGVLICLVLTYALAFFMGMYTANRGGKSNIKTEDGKGTGHVLPCNKWPKEHFTPAPGHYKIKEGDNEPDLTVKAPNLYKLPGE